MALALTPAGIAAGYSLTTWMDGFTPDGGGFGPMGVAFLAGVTYVTDSAGHIYVGNSTADGQHVGSLTLAATFGHDNAASIGICQGRIFVSQSTAGKIVELNADGTKKGDIITGLTAPDSIAVDNIHGYLYVESSTNNRIYRVDINAVSVITWLLLSGEIGLSITSDVAKLYAGISIPYIAAPTTRAVKTIRTSDGTVLATSSNAPGTGGINCASPLFGTLSGLLTLGADDGLVYSYDLNADTFTTIASGGDFIDQCWPMAGGSLLLTQGSVILRLAPPSGSTYAPPLPSAPHAPSVSESQRFLRVDWGFDALITRVRLKQEGPGAGNTGIDLESALSFLEGHDPPIDVPFQAYIPLPTDAHVHELVIDPPSFARGVVVFPDAYASVAGQSEVDLYQLQVYQLTNEGALSMANPVVKFTRVGVQGLFLYPWLANSSYPFPAGSVCQLLGLKELGTSVTSKVAMLEGGESPDKLGAWQTDREVKLKLSVGKADLRFPQLVQGGTLIVDPADSLGKELQYFAPDPGTRAPFVTVVAVCTNGDPASLIIHPKCILDGSFTANYQRDSVTDIECDLLVIEDDTYIRQDGTIGGLTEHRFSDGSLFGFHS